LDEGSGLLAVGGSIGDDWAIRVYQVESGGPVEVAGWTGSVELNLDFATVTSLSWVSAGNQLICGVEHLANHRTVAGLLLITLEDNNSLEYLDLAEWESVVAVEESTTEKGKVWIVGEGGALGRFLLFDPANIKGSLESELILEEVVSPNAVCQLNGILCVAGNTEKKGPILEMYELGERVSFRILDKQHYVSSMVASGDRIYLTGRTYPKRLKEVKGERKEVDAKEMMENFFLESIELGKNKKINALHFQPQLENGNNPNGIAERGREVGVSLLPLKDGGIVVAGYHQQYWDLGSKQAARLAPDSDGKGDFETFVARFNNDGSLNWAQSTGFRGNDFPLGLVPSGDDEFILLGNRKMGYGLGPYLEKVSVTGSVENNAPFVERSNEGMAMLSAITWSPQQSLRLGDVMDARYFSAISQGGSRFAYEINGVAVEEGGAPLFEPGDLEFRVRLVDEDDNELNATTRKIKGLKGRPYMKLIFEQESGGIQFTPQLHNIHPSHLAGDSDLVAQLLASVTMEVTSNPVLQVDENGFLSLPADFSAKLEVQANFPGDVFYEPASAMAFVQVKKGSLTELETQALFKVQVRDLDGWQKERLVKPGTDLSISAAQGFGKNRKFKKWVEFSEADQKLRTAHVQSPFTIRTSVRAESDMILFAHYNFTFIGTAINGYLGGSTVFLDYNLNGEFDEDEPSGLSKNNGEFEIEISEEDFLAHDLNSNGMIDPNEGMIVVLGGSDFSSKVPLGISYRAPASYSVITAVSTLVAEFAESGVSLVEAESLVSNYLGLPPGLDIKSYEPLREVFSDGEKAKRFILRSTQLANLLNEGSRFLEMASGAKMDRVGAAQKIITAIKDMILKRDDEPSSRRSISVDTLDLMDSSLLLEVINSAETLVDVEILEEGASDFTTASSTRTELVITQPEIAEIGNNEILDLLVAQISSANTQLDQLTNDPEVEALEFKSLASATQNILNQLGDDTANTLLDDEVDSLLQLSGADAVLAESIISRSSESIEEPSDDAFSLKTLTNFATLNQINVYAPVLTENEIVSPTEFTEGFVVGSLSAYDPEGEGIFYEIVGDNPDYDLDNVPILSIGETSGMIQIQDFDDLSLVTGEDVVTIVRLTDSQGLSRDEEVTLKIGGWSTLAGRLQIPDLTLIVPQNLPLGTTIHTFGVEDVYGGIIEYLLVNGLGDADNESFTIDTDGNLKTARIFDDESDKQILKIRIQAIDSRFNSVEKSLQMSVSNTALPNIQTGVAQVVEAQIQFAASMTLFENTASDWKLGFFLSRMPFSETNTTEIETIYGTITSDSSFIAKMDLSNASGYYYYKAFAQKAEDIVYGQEKVFVLPRITASDQWLDGDRITEYNSWWVSDWFGLYFTDSYPWIFHQNLGWVFVYSESSNGSWLFHHRLGWMWTLPEVFPFVYISKIEKWSYVSTERAEATLYDFDEGEWFKVNYPVEITVSLHPAEGGKIEGLLDDYYRWDTVELKAVAHAGYRFAGWNGAVSSMNPLITFPALHDNQIEVSFLKVSSSNSSTEEMIDRIQAVLNKMAHLSEAEKEKSLAELLIYGTSPTSGLSIIQEP